MPSLDVITEPIKFHLSLNVPDLERAVAFYSVLFGLAPAKRHEDYAKFELEDPPVVFSLVPHPPGPGASLSHIGFHVRNDDAIRELRERLKSAGVCTDTQDGTTCGYARQNKLWVKDPFENFWEVYRIEEDVLPESIRKSVEGKAARTDVDADARANTQGAAVVWEHFVTNPVPDLIPFADGAVDEVRLVGAFNADLAGPRRDALLVEAARVLKPGGKLLTHGLVGDRPFPGEPPRLPGLAMVVSRVPVFAEPIEALRRTGFVGIQVLRYTDKPWLTLEGVELREVKWIAWKPTPSEPAGAKLVLYKGPFSRATADGGHTFERGRRTDVSEAVWNQLRLGPTAEQFLFFEPSGTAACSGK